jgi:hypothetical protein
MISRLQKDLGSEMGLPAPVAAWSARKLLRPLSGKETEIIRRKTADHPVLSRSRKWTWVTPGNVPEPIALAVHAARIHGADLTLKVSRKLRRTGRRLASLLKGPGQKIRIVLDHHGLEYPEGSAWVVYGSDATLGEIIGRLPGDIPAARHGDKFSLSVIFRSAAGGSDPEVVRECAKDVSLYDQRGCLSPRILFVEGGVSDARRFAGRLYQALVSIQRREGRYRRDAAAASVRSAEIEELVVRSLDPKDLEFISLSSDGPVVYVPRRGVGDIPSGGQVVAVKAFRSMAQIRSAMKPFRRRLQGIAAAGTARERMRVRRAFRDSSAVYFTGPGRLQTPPLDWNL